jgi:hypothetical protein
MIPKPPPDRRTFSDARDELEYLFHKLLYWLYEREAPRRARHFAERLERLLGQTAAEESIFAEECRALVAEAKGNLREAIAHREKEVDLITRLHKLSLQTSHQDYVLNQYGYDDLSDRLDLLAILYHDSGDLDRAIRTLRGSQQLCLQHQIEFDGQDVLQEYLQEKKAS